MSNKNHQTGIETTPPISAATLPLPTGAATVSQNVLANVNWSGHVVSGITANYNPWSTQSQQSTPPNLVQQDILYQHQREYEIKQATHAERMDALKTFFPRGHNVIANLDVMIDIAREDQLNPLYEQVLKDFDEAKLAMSRVANKLASAVKLTDSEEIEKRAKKSSENFTNAVYHGTTTSYSYNLGVGQNFQNSSVVGIPGAQGATGVMGPMGPKGDKGDTGSPGRDGQSIVQSFLRWVRGLKK